MSENQYIDPVLKKYADLIQNTTQAFKRVYFGDPLRIGVSELPALILTKVDTRVSNFSNAEDVHEIRINITVVTDIRDTLSDDKDIVAGVNQLYNLMEGRQDTTYQLKTESLLNIIRHNVELDSGQNLRTDLTTATAIDYSMTFNKRKQNAWCTEGTLTLTANFTQPR